MDVPLDGRPNWRQCRAAALVLALTSIGSAACSGDGDTALRVVVIGGAEAPFETGPRLSIAAQLVRNATAQGLVAFDEQGRLVSALADRWIITDDGLSYIFRLRDGTWPDGKPLTAASTRAALRQAIAAQRGRPLALELDRLDIRVMTDKVIELRLEAPNPDLLQILAQPELGLLQAGRGSGPLRLVREGTTAELTRIPLRQLGLPEPAGEPARGRGRLRPIGLSALPAAQAVQRFRDGEADAVLGGTFRDLPLANRLGLARGSLQVDPVVGLFGLVVTHGDGFLALAENREALAMAIDRDALAGALGVSGWVSSSRVVAPGMEGDPGRIAERWTNFSLAERRAAAVLRVARWSGPGPLRLRVALPEGPGADLLFVRLAEDWRAAGIVAVRVAENAAADLRLVDVVARYARATWFLGQLSCAAGRGLCSEGADRLAAQARSTADPTARAALLADAEARLTVANVYIPLGAPLRWALVRGTGYAPNRFAIHPLMPLATVTR